MDRVTGATAADVVAALRASGHSMSSEFVAENWQLFCALAVLFNAGLHAEAGDAS